MTCWVAIAVKPPAECKTRLSHVLDQEQRRDLAASMLRQVYRAATAAPVEKVFLVGSDRHGLSPDVELVVDQGSGLNGAARCALATAVHAQINRLILLPADLPRIDADDVAALAAANGLLIASDHCRQGTNALSLPLPAAAAFDFRFGVGSFVAHLTEAHRLHLPVTKVERPGLMFDVDTAEDLLALNVLRSKL